MTHEEALEKALITLHQVGGAMIARKILREKPPKNPSLLATLQENALTDEAIESLTLDVWEDIVLYAEPRLTGVTSFGASPKKENAG